MILDRQIFGYLFRALRLFWIFLHTNRCGDIIWLWRVWLLNKRQSITERTFVPINVWSSIVTGPNGYRSKAGTMNVHNFFDVRARREALFASSQRAYHEA